MRELILKKGGARHAWLRNKGLVIVESKLPIKVKTQTKHKILYDSHTNITMLKVSDRLQGQH